MDACVSALRAWCKKHNIKLHERVLSNGRHHVWCYHVYRFDQVHRDFAFACLMMADDLRHAFPFAFDSSPRPEAKDGDDE